MNRRTTTLAVIGLLVAVYVVGRLDAARFTAREPAGPAQTRVGFVNLGKVFENSNKAKALKREAENLLAPLKLKADNLKKTIAGLEEKLANSKLTGAHKERWEKAIVDKKRELEDLQTDANKKLKKNEGRIVELYKEVHQAVSKHAAAQNFHAVLAYTELRPSLGVENVLRVVQGLQQSGCTAPLYIDPALDISKAVTDSLNAKGH